MPLSSSEHESKIDPVVGAVLFDEDGTELGRAHRGGLRIGAHAEYQLIDRVNADQDLEGSSLFVTLEPCTRRNPPRIPCAKRIVDARIQPDIYGSGISYLQRHGIEVNFFDKGLVETIRTENADFIEYNESLESNEESIAKESLLDSLDDELRQVLKLFEDNQRISTRECSTRFGVDVRTARRWMRNLRNMGLLKMQGSGPKRTTYWLNKKSRNDSIRAKAHPSCCGIPTLRQAPDNIRAFSGGLPIEIAFD